MHRRLVQYVFHDKAEGTYWDPLESLSNSRDIARRPTGFYSHALDTLIHSVGVPKE